MKINVNILPTSAGPDAGQTDLTPLVSLLALATSAIAIPQTGRADIIYTDMTTTPVVVGYSGVDSFLFDLPGAARAGFRRQQAVTNTQPGSNYRLVLAGDLGGGAPVMIRGGGASAFAAPQPLGATWNQGNVSFYNVAVGKVNGLSVQTPLNGYDHRYLAWRFDDSTQSGAARYGWVEISLGMASYSTTGPNVTIWGYAYDNTGAKPTMGLVPEPSSAAVLAVGALMLGARGLRNWRHHRETAGKS